MESPYQLCNTNYLEKNRNLQYLLSINFNCASKGAEMQKIIVF